MRRVGGPQPRCESASFIEPMHARVGSAALKQDVVAIPSPGFVKRSANDRAAVPTPLIIRMRHHVFDDPVLTAAPQKIGNGNQHACRDDSRVCVGYKDGQAVTRECFRPNLFGPLSWFGMATDLRRLEQREQGSEVGGVRNSGIGHLNDSGSGPG